MRNGTWLRWLLAAMVVGMLVFLIKIGAFYEWAGSPDPRRDPALDFPAWHPGDPGVVDLRHGGEWPQ